MRIGFFSDTYPPEINGVATATKALFDAFKKMMRVKSGEEW